MINSRKVLSSSIWTSFVTPLVASLALAFSLSSSAHASSVVVDGGFEAAGSGNIYFASQGIGDGAWTVGAGEVYVESGDNYVYAGSNSLNLTGVNPYVTDSIQQVVNTIIGQNYILNFFAFSDSANTFAVTENGLNIAGTPTSITADGSFDGSSAAPYTEYTGDFIATSATTTLQFSSVANPPIGSSVGSVLIDDVQLTATPEPGSFALLLTGMAGMAQLVRRRRSR